MATAQAFIEDLCLRYPDDAEDLRHALEVLRQQRLNSCERLLRLSDAYWQRLGLPLGIESLLRDELAAAAPFGLVSGAAVAATTTAATISSVAAAQSSAPAVAGSVAVPAAQAAGRSAGLAEPENAARAMAPSTLDRQAASDEEGSGDDDGTIPLEPFEPPDGLYRRGGSSGGGRRAVESQEGVTGVTGSSRLRQGAKGKSQQEQGLLGPLELTPPGNLEELWMQLLEDTLPPDRHPALQATWEGTPDPHERYMMLLEYSSYLRKPELTEEEKAERKKAMEPLMRELGIPPDGEDDGGCPGFILWVLLIGMLIFFGGTAYCYRVWFDPLHDTQSL